ncbi:FtsX-like permease family protein [Mucilaginibacter sp.]|uniref:FtsX-like permease family protein n=1 Tax=Mucilaginibacter sp. TaxID=1882438 RepID=UPI0026224E53|nr:FtsX-like permease family protein [Mucilaginibacter sp.]
MNTSIYIAKRYLFSRKKMHAINIISGISMLGVLIGSAALIIILSVFNGFEEVILSLYSNFTPEIKIEPRMGKTFNPNTVYFNTLRKDDKVFSFIEVLQEKVLVKYDGKPVIGSIKGVSAQFMKRGNLDSIIQSGSFTLKRDGNNYAVIGSTVQSSLGVSIRDQFTPLEIYSPNRDAGTGANPLNAFTVRPIYPTGIFGLGQEFDDLIITPIDFARDLLNQPVNVSSLEINFKKGTNLKDEQDVIKDKIGHNFTVKNRSQQNAELYKTLNYERWFIFMILVFVLIIAIFNIIGSLTMLVMDKRKDIAILTSLGANKQLIQGIFFFEGMMISITGCIAGIFLGLIFCILQQRFGLVKMGTDKSIIDAYPIALLLRDFILVFLTVVSISVIASGISARLSIKGLNDIKQDL